MDSFKIGDRVSFLDDVGGGIIVGLESQDEAMIETEDGFEVPYPTDKLVLVGTRQEQEDAYQLDKNVVDGFVEKRVFSEDQQKKATNLSANFVIFRRLKRKKRMWWKSICTFTS